MSRISRIRKRQKKGFQSRLTYNGGPDRVLGAWQLIDVHLIPAELAYGKEFDFWCHNGVDLFLLRLRKAPVEQFSIVKSPTPEAVIYLVAEFDFDDLGDEVLEGILKQFEERGIPKYRLRGMRLKR